MLTIDSVLMNGQMGMNSVVPGAMHSSGYDKLGANSPLLRVGTTITTSTNISTSGGSQ